MIITWCETNNTNSKHLELYTILGEYDNTGFPLSYCLLTTATTLENGARTRALEAWATNLHDNYSVNPRFVHTDKDMAEIGASRHVWPGAKHQLCWWHQREAVQRRLKGNLPTSTYNVWRAKHEHTFIDQVFHPYGHVDPNDSKGCVPEEIYEQETHGTDTITKVLTGDDPNSIKICLPILASQSAQREKLTIRIPSLSSRNHDIEAEDELEDDAANVQRTFCPIEHRDTIVKMMEHHFCVHPLIPRYSAPTPEGIKSWAVKQTYEYCVHYDLPNLWAYLWENWYRRGQWELWARSGNPGQIPRLKTTMFVEGQ